jgi:putative colanic acid biosynthesis acetyltransferase WcaF
LTQVKLSTFNNEWYKPGSKIKRLIWYFINAFVFNSGIFPVYGLKRSLLRLFGARIGKGVLIKPYVNIKYPWFLEVGDYTWVGEKVWIDNLGQITIGSNVCISQGAYLLTGNHDYKSSSFGLMVKGIIIEDGAWIGAKSTVCPGVTCKSHSLLSVGSIATKDLEEYTIYQGNPAVKVKGRNVL